MRIIDIITERQEQPMGNMGLTIFDIDDTLFHTTAQIKVIKDGKVVRSLTNQEFNNYELQPGEEFDFGEFRSAEKFAKESEPIKPMINTLKRILDRAANTKVIMLTARADFDDKDKFLSTFEKYGIDMSRIHVHRAGNLPGDEPPAYKKAVWVRKYLNTGKYNRVNLIDDSMTNLKVFKSLEQEYPNVDFDAYFVKSSGSVAVVSESRRKKKSRQRKQNSLFSRNTYGGYGAWGPGPYGGYGYDSGYSGDGGGEAESIKEKLDSYGNVQGDPIGDLIKNLDKQKTNPAKSSTKSPVVKKDTGQAAQPATITGNALEKTLRDFALKAGIKGKELAQFLAQCAHESANYSTLVEFGASQDFLKKYDKQFSPDKAKELGNTAPGDGERFKGRGFIQLTGRWNYTQAGQALGLPLDNKPELLEKPDIAAKASVWFWKNRVQPNVRNFTDTRTVTSYINPGLRGLQKRHGLFQNYLQTMQKTVKENVIQNMEFIDVYLRGRHKGNMITKSVAKNFPNRKLDQLIQYLIDKHGVNPSAIVYGPSKDNTTDEDYHPNDPPPGPETKPTMPKGTVRIDVSDVYDWYKLGQHISNLKGLGKHDFGKGPPSTIISFGSEEEEHKYIQDLMKLGLTTTDIDPIDPNQPRNMPKQKVDPTFKVDENFADGRNPQDKGDSARHGIPKKSSISTLKKIRSSDTASPRKKQLAHWQINMRQGKKRSSK